MLLGGIRYLLPVIKAAHEQGYYVITADYLPDNIAHKYSDDYVNVSIIDKVAVLKAAIDKKIDGIMSFGVDPGVVSAAYVQDVLGLPSFGPYESVCILQNKDRFRSFLSSNGFNVPKAKGYSTIEEAMADQYIWEYPIIVKPTDSAGSKGVSRVDDASELETSLKQAFSQSFSGHVIVEDFIKNKGCSSDSDCMSINGKLVFVSFNSQFFDECAANPYTPAAYSWPSTFTKEQESELTSEIQRLITLLGMTTSVYNVETRIGIDGRPYIMELTPRGGGNRLCEMIRFATGVDLISAITRYSVGDTVPKIIQKPYNGHWAEFILHAGREGYFNGIDLFAGFPGDIIDQDIWISCGDYVRAFNGANDAIGTLVMSFNDSRSLSRVINSPKAFFSVNIV